MKAYARRRPRTQHKPSRSSFSSNTGSTQLSSYLPRLLRAIALALPVTLAAALILSLIGTAILCSLPDPDTPLLPVALSILLFCALLFGAIVGRRTEERLPAGGMICGLLLLVLLFVLSFPFSGGTEAPLPSWLALPLRIAVLFFALLGAYLGGHLPARRTARTPKRK